MGSAITYTAGCFEVTGFFDASWETTLTTASPPPATCSCWLGDIPLGFKTALRNVTAQSTVEAERISMEHASKEAVYLSNMMAELGYGKLIGSVPLLSDNAGAIHIAGNSVCSSGTKHIALNFYYLKGLVKDGKITVHHVATQKKLADIGTKFLTKYTHRHLLNLIETCTTRNDM